MVKSYHLGGPRMHWLRVKSANQNKDHLLDSLIKTNEIYTNSERWWGCGSLIHCCWECTIAQPPWKSGAVSHKTKYTLTIQLNNSTLGHLCQRNGNLYSHKNLYVDVHSSFIHKVPKQEPTEMSFSRWMVKEPVIHPNHEIPSVIKRNKLLTHATTWMDLKEDILSKEKKNLKRLHLHNSIYTTFLKWENYREEQEMNGCQGWWGRGRRWLWL